MKANGALIHELPDIAVRVVIRPEPLSAYMTRFGWVQTGEESWRRKK